MVVAILRLNLSPLNEELCILNIGKCLIFKARIFGFFLNLIIKYGPKISYIKF